MNWPRGLSGSAPEGAPWEVSLHACDGRPAGHAVSSGGAWTLPWPESAGLYVLTLRRAGGTLRRAVLVPPGR